MHNYNASVPILVLALCAIVLLPATAANARSHNAMPAATMRKALPPKYQRICALGDSITDGFSTALMLRQALEEAHYAPPYVICAGVASDVSAQMLARLDRDVFPYHPTLVTLLAGTNDGERGVTVDEYAVNVTAIADRCDKAGVKFIIITAPIYGPKNVAKEPIIDQYNDWIKKFAKLRGYPVADSNTLMKADRAAGKDPIENDNIHPNYLGHQDMTRALLDAMGFTDVPIVKVFKPELMPGIISTWQVRVTPAAMTTPLTADQVAALKTDSTWTTVTVPVSTPLDNWWLDQERQRGFVGPLKTLVGPGKSYQAIATVDSKLQTKQYMNMGAEVTAAWLNGVKVYTVGPWTGWHVGHDRVQVTLNKGTNAIVVECGDPFFISLTDTTDVGPFDSATVAY